MQKDLRKRQEVWILGVVLAFLLIAFAGAALVLQLYSYNYSKGERTNYFIISLKAPYYGYLYVFELIYSTYPIS